MEKKKVIVYVDGYNFYYGLKNGGAKRKKLYWLDIVKFFERMMLPDQELEEVGSASIWVIIPVPFHTAIEYFCPEHIWVRSIELCPLCRFPKNYNHY
jgi:hypothetical protein